MRSGDFAVEVVPRSKGVGVRELKSGHVLARSGQVYALRLRNFGPLRCVADIRIDGRLVTAGGLVIDAWCTEELERPITPNEDGCFTVVAEGDERVFGADGGRDNEQLGLIEVRFRRELPGGPERPRPLPPTLAETFGRSFGSPTPARLSRPDLDAPVIKALGTPDAAGPDRFGGRLAGIMRQFPADESITGYGLPPDDAERAAGTGLTGHSAQRFTATKLGPLESEATVITLRLVIATEEAIRSAPPLTEERTPPERPAARP